MIINRVWAMPNHNTFSIRPVMHLIQKYLEPGLWIDPFSRNSPFAEACITNDLNPEVESDHHLESWDFMNLFQPGSVDGILFDPPYSVRQIAECYKQVGRAVHASDTQSSFYGDRKRKAGEILKPGGIAISFGWNSGGIGKQNGMEIVEILLVPHGGPHNDTICVVEKKVTMF